MFFTPVNYPAVGISAIASMVVGFLWYSPMLFGTPWMKLSGLDDKKMKAAQKDMPKTYGISFVASLITAYVIATLVNSMLVSSLSDGLALGTVLWLGFVATTMVTGVLFQKMPWALFLINSGCQLASILAMSAILTVWI